MRWNLSTCGVALRTRHRICSRPSRTCASYLHATEWRADRWSRCRGALFDQLSVHSTEGST